MKIEIESVKHPGHTKRVRRNEAKILVELGRFRYCTTALKAGPPARRDPFEGVDFASDAAYEAARAAGLNASAFDVGAGSGKDGAFTKADVFQIIRDWA